MLVSSSVVEAARKITVEVPPKLLEKAQEATGAGISETVRAGLELVVASRASSRLRRMHGKVRFSRTMAELKADRHPDESVME
jgi:Arc/MetJ-type ribon-helix-helix transcriptional regulator